MSSVGSYLRQLRTQRGVSLEEIARSTRVMHSYLEALEADEFETLPAPVFAKGFIRAYCQALGVSPDEAFALWDQRGGEGAEAKPAAMPTRPAPVPTATTEAVKRREAAESRSRSAVLAGFVMLVVLGLALFAMTLWLQPSGEQQSERRAVLPAPAPQAVPVAETPLAATPPQPVPAATVAAPTAAAPAPASSAEAPRIVGVTSPYRLVARTSERTWMRVRTEDGRSSEENIPAGETREWVSNRPFVLTIGNAGGVALELNGRRVPRLGPSGAVIERLVLPSDAP
jgi:cytoskeleton protein RodZ